MYPEGCNCNVLSETDASHVTKMTPIEIKRRELKEAAAQMEPQERAQEIKNSEIRQKSHVRPLGGSQ